MAKASNKFVEELTEMCAEPGEVMTLPDLQEASSRMLKITRGEWCINDPIPVAFGEDKFRSFLAQYFKVFPYGRNIDTIIIVVMDKDRLESLWKKRKAPLRLVDP